MSTYDVIESFTRYMYDLITTDSDVQTAMGGTVRLYFVWAEPDAVFPYLVHKLDVARSADPTIFPLRQNLYYLDLWSESPNATEILLMRDKLMELIDERSTGNDELGTFRIWSEGERFILDDNQAQNIWHYELVFNVRFYRVLETADILARG